MAGSAQVRNSDEPNDRGIVLTNFQGLNNVGDVSALADNELSEIMNLELDSNGSLTQRPPWTRRQGFPSGGLVGYILGYYNRSDGVSFVVVAHNNNTYLWDPDALAYTLIASFPARDIAQYQNRLYLVATTTRGGWWGEVTPGSGVYTYQSLSGGGTPMPRGENIVLYKDRLFISGSGSSDERTKVYMSEITTTLGTDINNWPVNNFFYVGRGDGQWITGFYAGPDVLNIFRNASAAYFNYDNDPALGSLKFYTGAAGADNQRCIATYQNYVLTLSNGALYQLIGYQFIRLNDPSKIQFATRTTVTPFTVDVALSVIGKRAIVWYSGQVFVFDLNTRIWTQWNTYRDIAYAIEAPRPQGYFGAPIAYGITGSGNTSWFGMYRMVDEINSTNSETMDCYIATKAFDFQTPDKYKKLFWWSADVSAASPVTGTAIPVVLATAITTWDIMSTKTWDQLSTGTWDNPTVITPGVITIRNIPGASPYRVSVKFRKKMVFRRILFRISIQSDGTLATGPVRIFSIVPYVTVGQQISKGVT